MHVSPGKQLGSSAIYVLLGWEQSLAIGEATMNNGADGIGAVAATKHQARSKWEIPVEDADAIRAK